MDRDDLLQVRDALEQSERIDARRIELSVDGDAVVLQGSVSEPEEASAAELLAGSYAARVVNQLRVDQNLREGTDDPLDAERTAPAEGEILVGSTDMLAGPDAEITSDMTEAFEENEPWDPPTEPHLAPTAAEQRGVAGADGGPTVTRDPDPDVDRRPSAADLTQADLERAARGGTVPSLDPERVAPPGRAQPDPFGVEELGDAPGPLDPQVERVPGTEAGPGATGEGTAGGGSTSGVAATETGALGADTAAADPARSSTGGTGLGTGTKRGPDSPDDPAIREDFPEAD